MAKTNNYIEMCRKAKLFQDLHIFNENDEFFSLAGKIEKVKKILNNQLGSTIDNLYPIDKCYWLPAIEQIKEMFQDFIDNPDYLYQQFSHDKKLVWKYPWPKVYFRSEEERWLALYMAERFKLFWNNQKKDWLKHEDF